MGRFLLFVRMVIRGAVGDIVEKIEGAGLWGCRWSTYIYFFGWKIFIGFYVFSKGVRIAGVRFGVRIGVGVCNDL